MQNALLCISALPLGAVLALRALVVPLVFLGGSLSPLPRLAWGLVSYPLVCTSTEHRRCGQVRFVGCVLGAQERNTLHDNGFCSLPLGAVLPRLRSASPPPLPRCGWSLRPARVSWVPACFPVSPFCQGSGRGRGVRGGGGGCAMWYLSSHPEAHTEESEHEEAPGPVLGWGGGVPQLSMCIPVTHGGSRLVL